MTKYMSKLKIEQLCNANPYIKWGWREFIKDNSDKTNKIIDVYSTGDISGWWCNFSVYIKYEYIGYTYEWFYSDDGNGNIEKGCKNRGFIWTNKN